MKPVIIALDGVDYAGKSTMVGRVKAELERSGYGVHVVGFPTNCGKGAVARECFLNDDAVGAAENMIGNMVEVLDGLHELSGPDVVIYDRFTASTYANQGFAVTESEIVSQNLAEHPMNPERYYVFTLAQDAAIERHEAMVAYVGKAWDDDRTEEVLYDEERWVEKNKAYNSAAKIYSAQVGDDKLKVVNLTTSCKSQSDKAFDTIMCNLSFDLNRARLENECLQTN